MKIESIFSQIENDVKNETCIYRGEDNYIKLSDDETSVYRDEDHYVKLSDDEVSVCRGKNNCIKLSDNETAVYHDKSNCIKFDGSNMKVGATGYLAKELQEALSDLVTALNGVMVPTALGPATLGPNVMPELVRLNSLLKGMLAKYDANV